MLGSRQFDEMKTAAAGSRVIPLSVNTQSLAPGVGALENIFLAEDFLHFALVFQFPCALLGTNNKVDLLLFCFRRRWGEVAAETAAYDIARLTELLVGHHNTGVPRQAQVIAPVVLNGYCGSDLRH